MNFAALAKFGSVPLLPPNLVRQQADRSICVVDLARGVLDRGENVLALKKRVILEDFLERSPCSQQFQHVRDADALAANAGTSPALAFFNRDSLAVAPY